MTIKLLTAALLLLASCSIRVMGQYSQEQVRRIEAARLEAQKAEALGSLKGEMGPFPRVGPFALLPLKLNDAEKRKLYPSEQDKDQFAAFLKQPKTGLVRLLPGDGCNDNTGVLNATEPCASHTIAKIVGGGAYYSFRLKTHAAGPWSDISFSNNSFRVGGKLQQALLAPLGDVPLDAIGFNSAGIRFVFDFVPATKRAEVLKQTTSINQGLVVHGFTYAYTQPVLNNTTYVLRSIAYQTKSRAHTGDKRIDIIVAFRVVRKDTDGSVILLWKELARAKSPKLKL